MAKYILLNENFNIKDMPYCDYPYKIEVNDLIWQSLEKHCLDLSSEIFTMYLTRAQKNWLQDNRAKNFYFETYLPKKVILDILDSLDSVFAWAISPCHDCDTFETGELKKPHYHIILQFVTNYSFSKIAYLFHTRDMRKLGENWFNEYHYLYHGSERCKKLGKYLYKEEEIVASDIEYVKSKCVPVLEKVKLTDILFDVLNGMSTRNLCNKYQFLYSKNRKDIDILVERIRYEENLGKERIVDYFIKLGIDEYLVYFTNGMKTVYNYKEFIKLGVKESEK